MIKIIIVAILVPLSIYLWPAAFGGDTEFLIVSGQSMYPTIQDGSLVITKDSPPYEIGDIVAYYSKESRINVVHRIIDQNNGAFTIKGDNNKNDDAGSYTADDIFGEVVFATPFVGQGLELFRNPIILFMAAIALIAIQMEQKRRKKKKEKIRRILLGLPKPDPDEKNKNNKPQKPSYSTFLTAMILNIMTYVSLQISIAYQIKPKGDQATGFLFNILEPSFASTLSFGLYAVFILGLYYITKNSYHKAKYETKVSRKSNQSLELLLGKNFKPVPSLTQFLAIMFCIMAVFHLIAISSNIAPLLNS